MRNEKCYRRSLTATLTLAFAVAAIVPFVTGCDQTLVGALDALRDEIIANGGLDQFVRPGQLVVLDASASRTNRGNLSFAWRQVSGPLVELSGAKNCEATTVPTETGVLEFEVTVTDDQRRVSTDMVTVTVNNEAREACTSHEDCDDGEFCTGVETCEDGRCLGGEPPCLDDEICVEQDQRCQANDIPDGQAEEPEESDVDDAGIAGVMIDAGDIVETADVSGTDIDAETLLAARVVGGQLRITNRHTGTVYYSVRWGNGRWSSYSLQPNYYRTHWCDGCGNSATIEFDWSFSSGYQRVQYNVNAGNDYNFQRISGVNGIDLYRTGGFGGGGGGGVSRCTNTCRYAYDGECDDGGAGADYNVCSYGTDCADCGSR